MGYAQSADRTLPLIAQASPQQVQQTSFGAPHLIRMGELCSQPTHDAESDYMHSRREE